MLDDFSKGEIGRDFGMHEICKECIYLDTNSIAIDRIPKCRAYPNGIPREIWKGINDHSKPQKGDNGIVFESIYADWDKMSAKEHVTLMMKYDKERDFNMYDIRY